MLSVDAKEQPLAVPWILSNLVLKIGYFLALELTRWARLAGQQAPGTHLSPVLQHWNYKHMPLCLGYLYRLWALGVKLKFGILMLLRATILLAEIAPSSSSSSI